MIQATVHDRTSLGAVISFPSLPHAARDGEVKLSMVGLLELAFAAAAAAAVASSRNTWCPREMIYGLVGTRIRQFLAII